MTTIFDKIVSGEIPCKKIYEDELTLAFEDIAPAAPKHVLLIPKNKDGLCKLTDALMDQHKELLGHLMCVVPRVAAAAGLEDNFRVVINNGEDACQTVWHLHLHIIGGRKMGWPPG